MGVFCLDLLFIVGNGRRITNRYLFTKSQNLAPLLHVPKSTLNHAWDSNNRELAIVNSASWVALLINLQDDLDFAGDRYVRFSDNYFTLFPGETKVIAVDYPESTGESLRFRAWNSPEYFI